MENSLLAHSGAFAAVFLCRVEGEREDDVQKKGLRLELNQGCCGKDSALIYTVRTELLGHHEWK